MCNNNMKQVLERKHTNLHVLLLCITNCNLGVSVNFSSLVRLGVVLGRVYNSSEILLV